MPIQSTTGTKIVCLAIPLGRLVCASEGINLAGWEKGIVWTSKSLEGNLWRVRMILLATGEIEAS